MAKKKVKKRQNDPYCSESSEDEIAGKKCTHLAKGINLPALRKSLQQAAGGAAGGCEGCSAAGRKTNEEPEEQPEEESSSEPQEVAGKETWVCLQCGHRGCGRQDRGCSLHHHETPHSSSHDLAVSTSSWGTWCYRCDDYVSIDSSRLKEAVDLVKRQTPAGVAASAATTSPPESKRTRQKVPPPPAAPAGSAKSAGKDSGVAKTLAGALPGVKGLANLGNTCFFNAVLQVLSQTHWLTQLLDLEIREGQVLRLSGSVLPDSGGPGVAPRSLQLTSSASSSDSGLGSGSGDDSSAGIVAEPIDVILSSGKALTLTLASFLKEMHCPAAAGATTPGSGGGKARSRGQSSVSPSCLFNQVCKKTPQFRGFQQQDAHELLRHLMDGVRTEEVARRRLSILNHFNIKAGRSSAGAGGASLTAGAEGGGVDAQMRSKLKIYGLESGHTFVDQLFGGVLLSTVICESCHQPQQMVESFMDLSLPVSEDKTPPAGASGAGAKRRGIASCLSSSAADSPAGSPARSARRLRPPPPVETPAAAAPESGGESSDSGESEGGDVEDNNDDGVAELERAMSRLEPLTPAAALRVQSDWISRSLCSLQVRYQASNSECSVQSCLNSFTAPELLTGSNKYACANCTRRSHQAKLNHHQQETPRPESRPESLDSQSADSDNPESPLPPESKPETVYTVASKQLLIFAPPAILTLHLKRFTQNAVALRKVQRHVHFPVTLDLAPFCSSACAGVGTVDSGQRQVLYNLYGVIEHSGRLSGGHYTAYVKVRPVRAPESLTKFLLRLPIHTSDLESFKRRLSAAAAAETLSAPMESRSGQLEQDAGAWYHVSDTQVMPVTQEKVMRSQAFLLFYERVF